MNYKKYGLIMLIIGLVLLVLGIVKLFPKKQNNTQTIDVEFNDLQLQTFIRAMEKYLKPTKDIDNHTGFSLEEMIQFTFVYIDYFDDEDKIALLDEEKSLGIVNVDVLKENIVYLFGVDGIDINKTKYEENEGKLYIPLNLQGGDAVIYKYVETNRTNINGEYIATIDCLAPTSPQDVSTLLSKSEYDKDNVIMTLKIRYKTVNDRKILLAYSAQVNM